VDGIYTADPKKDPTATKYERISYSQALAQRLEVMDSTAFTLCMDNRVPILVFDLMTPNNIRNAILGQRIGTLVTSD
jgi:uridylate kinase